MSEANDTFDADKLALLRAGHWSGFTSAKNELLDEIERLQAELSARTAGEWIAVTERVPDAGQRCLVYWKLVEPPAENMLDALFTYNDKFIDNCDDDEIFGVTHWQPIPAPPSLSPPSGVQGETKPT